MLIPIIAGAADAAAAAAAVPPACFRQENGMSMDAMKILCRKRCCELVTTRDGKGISHSGTLKISIRMMATQASIKAWSRKASRSYSLLLSCTPRLWSVYMTMESTDRAPFLQSRYRSRVFKLHSFKTSDHKLDLS